MGADEDSTLSALKGHRNAAVPIGHKHGGRVVGTAGDGELWEFPSLTEAVLSAVEVQAVMAERNAGLRGERKMLYRIGINLGDVMIDGEDIYGDGINVAARIEALAEPGGVWLSQAVHDQIRDRMNLNLEDMGEVAVKNIARPVRVFRVLAEGEQSSTPARWSGTPWLKYGSAVVVVLALVVGSSLWWWWQQAEYAPAVESEISDPLPDELPFFEEIKGTGAFARRDPSALLTGTVPLIGDMLCHRIPARLLGRDNCGYVYRNSGGSAAGHDQYIYVNATSVSYFSPLQ